jgi:hypothetical protein
VKPPREAPFPSETALHKACQKRVREEWGGECVKIHGTAAQRAGTPDLLICLGGRFVACECKQPGKKPTPLQMKRLRDWQAAGAIAGWVTTEVELDELLVHADHGDWVNPALEAA